MNSFEQGLKHLADNDIDKAISLFTQAIQEDNKNYEAFYNRGKAYRLKGDLISSINDYYKVLEIKPDYTEAAVAIDMMRNIISFRNPDLLNH